MAGAVYWTGADGNLYYGDGQGGGVQNLGSASSANHNLSGAGFESDTLHQSIQAKQIPDPVPPATNNNTGGNTGGTSAATLAATQAQDEAKYHSNLQAANNSINTNIGAQAGQYGTDVLGGFHDSGGFNSRQAGINNEGIQNEMSKYQGMQGVRDMVNNGIQGGGVVLDNAGAGTSSAGEALARAYGVQGRQQASKVGVQYAQGQNSINSEQNTLNDNEDFFMNNKMPTEKANAINNIVSSAQQSLMYLNAIASGSKLPDMVDINQKIAEVKAQATAALSAFDNQLASARAANAPMMQDAQQSQAAKMIAQGTAPARAFDFTSQAPAQLQGTGPAASQLPIYLSSAQNKNDNGIPV